MVARLGEVMWVVDLNRQSLDRVVPDIAAGRLAAMFEAAGWHTVMVKYGPRLAQRPDLRARIDAMPNEEYQRLLRAPAPRAARADRGRRRRPRRRRPARHVPRPRRPRPREPDRRLPPGRRGPRPPERRLRLHDQGLVAADRGPSRQPLGAAQPRAVPRARRPASARTPTTRSSPSPPARPRRACARRPAAASSAAPCAPCPRRRSRPTSAASTPARPPRSRPSAASSSTSPARRPTSPQRVVTVSPDVGTSTNLGGWINKAGIWSVGDRIDWFADDTDTLVRWREHDHGRHIELGIAEVNLVGLLGELGATWSRDGQPLLPVGTIYDPFVSRALEPWSFGIYAGGQSILVGTPVRRHARPRGRRAPVGDHAQHRHRAARLRRLRAGVRPGLRVVLPARALPARQARRDERLLPPLDAPDRPVAAHRHARAGDRRRLQAAAARHAGAQHRRHGRARPGGARRPPTPSPTTPGSTSRSSASPAPTCCSAPSRPAPASATATRARSSGSSARASRSSACSTATRTR